MSKNNSVDRILRILELIALNPQGLTLSEISHELGIAKTTCYDYIETLYNEDAIYYKDEIKKTYVIGSKVYLIGQAYQKNSSLINVCKPFISKLSNDFDVLFLVSKRVDKNIVIVHKKYNSNIDFATPEIGSSISYFHSNSIGKCYLAFDQGFNPKNLDLELVTSYTIIDKDRLDYEIKNAIKDGYTKDFNEDEEGFQSLSFPIFNFENRCCGAITIKALSSMNISDKFISLMISISQKISHKLGYKNGGLK
jgi:DNA-binding IclR family transcriptional regulator